jgi:hypothetical protein
MRRRTTSFGVSWFWTNSKFDAMLLCGSSARYLTGWPYGYLKKFGCRNKEYRMGKLFQIPMLCTTVSSNDYAE